MGSVAGVSDLHTLHVNGIRMAYRTWGEPDAPPLVLLHGRGSDGADWLPVVPALAATHRVYAPDLRGHGASDRPGEYAFEAMRDDVVAFLDALGPEPVVLAGHSMGAVVAYLVAAERSSRLTALVLEEPVPPDPEVPPRAVPCGPEGDETCDWRVIAAVNRWRNAPDPGWWELLATIDCPTLVLAAWSGQPCPPGRDRGHRRARAGGAAGDRGGGAPGPRGTPRGLPRRGQRLPSGAPSLTGSPARSQAWNPPSRSVARVRPTSSSEAAARLEV